jgi:DNA-binding response OmpR family regulator
MSWPANSIRAALAAPSNASFGVHWVRELSAGLERLSKVGIAAVLLDLALPDSQGIETFDKVFTAAARGRRSRCEFVVEARA